MHSIDAWNKNVVFRLKITRKPLHRDSHLDMSVASQRRRFVGGTVIEIAICMISLWWSCGDFPILAIPRWSHHDLARAYVLFIHVLIIWQTVQITFSRHTHLIACRWSAWRARRRSDSCGRILSELLQSKWRFTWMTTDAIHAQWSFLEGCTGHTGWTHCRSDTLDRNYNNCKKNKQKI